MSQSIRFSRILISTCGVLTIASLVCAQYNTFDSDSNTDSNGSPILTQSELRKLAARQAATSASESNDMGSNLFYPNNKAAKSQLRKRNGFEEASGFASQSFGNGQENAGLAGLMRSENAKRRKMQMAANSYDEDSEGAAIGPNFDEDVDFNARPGIGLNQAASGGFDGEADFGPENGVEQASGHPGFGLDAGSSEHESASFGSVGGYDASSFDAAGLTPKSSYRQPHSLGLEESALGYGSGHISSAGQGEGADDDAENEGDDE